MSEKHVSRRGFVGGTALGVGAAALAGAKALAAEEKQPMRVRLGLNLLLYTVDFPKERIDLIPKIAEMGYDGVELPFIVLDVIDAAATRRAIEQAKIGATACAVLTPGTSLISDKPEERQAGIERIKKCVDLAAACGCDAVAGPLYHPVGVLAGRGRTEDEWKRGVEGLRASAEHAAKANITIAIEYLNRFETYFLNTAADTLALVREVNSPNLKVQIDTFHGNIEEKDTAAAIRAVGAHLGHFHACENDRGTPGTGQVPWEKVFAALREINYSRWITIESFARGIRDLCAAACIWRDIYDSPDGLARQGLAFLKKMTGRA